MKSSVGTDALVALEDAAPDLLFETFPRDDIQMWPLLRWLVAKSVAEAELGTFAVRRASSRTTTVSRAVRRLLPNRWSSARARQADALFVVSGTTSGGGEHGRSNWLVDDHARALNERGGAVVIQDQAIDRNGPERNHPEYPRTYSFENAAVQVEAAARFLGPSVADLAFADDYVDRIYGLLGIEVDPGRIAETKRQFRVRFGRAPHTERHFSRLLDRVAPRVAFVQTAAYGDRSHLIALLKARGIHVAEHQHGWIGPSHGAYNFGDAMSRPELARTLPDTLLTFGDFWSDGIRFPGKSVAIGKSHLDEARASARPVAERDRVVMVVSSVYDRDEVTRFTLRIRDLLPPDWRVVLRPHPSERATVAALYSGLIGQERVEFDLVPDVYQSLGTVRGVFGLASTVLYEALALGCEVHVKDSPLTDLYISDGVFGPRVADELSLRNALASIVTNTDRAQAPYREDLLHAMWKPDATANLIDFVSLVSGDLPN